MICTNNLGGCYGSRPFDLDNIDLISASDLRLCPVGHLRSTATPANDMEAAFRASRRWSLSQRLCFSHGFECTSLCGTQLTQPINVDARMLQYAICFWHISSQLLLEERHFPEPSGARSGSSTVRSPRPLGNRPGSCLCGELRWTFVFFDAVFCRPMV